MFVLMTDFGVMGPYLGQMKAVLKQQAPEIPIIDLFADAPAFDPKASAYLLAAYAPEFPPGTVFLCVVDPGVGSARRGAILKADGRWLVGPDNGLFNVIGRRAADLQWWDIDWRPVRLSTTFHGRDLFAPVAARIARGEMPPGRLQDARARLRPDWPEDLPQIIYIDHYGNAMTGLRAERLSSGTVLKVCGIELRRVRTFSEVPCGEPFWYENANGLAEIAVNRGSAANVLGLGVGSAIAVSRQD
jgi:S-adenosyl-L-methionine hydrolase (adenosine-forming)